MEEFTAEGTYPPGTAYALGKVFVYDDLNGNGKLDFTPSSSPDLAR